MSTWIRTERLLLLRPIEPADASALFEVFRLPEVARWSGTGIPMTDISDAHARIERWSTRGGSHPAAGVFAVVRLDTGAMIGTALLVPLPPSGGGESHHHEIGWHLHPDTWGHGFATEAATALVARGFAAGIPHLMAVTDPDNVRSQAVCARLGMVDLGLTSDWYDQELRAFRLDPS